MVELLLLISLRQLFISSVICVVIGWSFYEISKYRSKPHSIDCTHTMHATNIIVHQPPAHICIVQCDDRYNVLLDCSPVLLVIQFWNFSQLHSNWYIKGIWNEWASHICSHFASLFNSIIWFDFVVWPSGHCLHFNYLFDVMLWYGFSWNAICLNIKPS